MTNDVFSNETTLRRTISVHSLYGFGFFQLGKNEICKIKYPAFCLIFCDKGTVKTSFSAKRADLTGGNCVFFAPNAEFSLVGGNDGARIGYAVFSVKENSISYFCGKPINVSSFAKALLLRLNKLAPEYFDKSEIHSLAKLPQKKNDAGIFTEQSIRLLLELFIIECIKPAYKSIISGVSENETATESQKITAAIYEYLSSRVKEKVTLSELSDALFFSSSYIKKAFKKETGKTVMEAFSELKIEEAQKMIALGVPFNEIADELSFCSKNYFSKVFKDVVGTTPTEYKKSL